MPVAKKVQKTKKNSAPKSKTSAKKTTQKNTQKANFFEQKKTYYRKKRPIICVQNLVKKYGNLTAVDDISFEVKKGEVFGILGTNGAGKTTTLEIIETLITKTSGKVSIDGLDIDFYEEEVKNLIGVQLQEGGFFPDLKLKEILKLFADIYNVKTNPKEVLKSVGLLEKKDAFYDNLSAGQKQRFSIIVTLIAKPMIVFLDEPTTGLDPQARRNIWNIISDLKKQGTTVVITTHYMDEAEQLCDRIAIMDKGKIVEINTVDGFVKDLLKKGFKKEKPKLGANMEDVFLDFTGKKLRD